MKKRNLPKIGEIYLGTLEYFLKWEGPDPKNNRWDFDQSRSHFDEVLDFDEDGSFTAVNPDLIYPLKWLKEVRPRWEDPDHVASKNFPTLYELFDYWNRNFRNRDEVKKE